MARRDLDIDIDIYPSALPLEVPAVPLCGTLLDICFFFLRQIGMRSQCGRDKEH